MNKKSMYRCKVVRPSHSLSRREHVECGWWEGEVRPSGEGGPDGQAEGSQWVTLNCGVTWLDLHIRKVLVKASVQRIRVRWKEGGQ